RASEAFATIPIIAFVPSNDVAVLEAFYGSGADVVFQLPLDATVLFHQAASLTRLKRHFNETITKARESAGLTSSVMNAFHTVREGMIITDTTLLPIFANNAAGNLLGFPNSFPVDRIREVFDPLVSVIKREINSASAKSKSYSGSPLVIQFETTIARYDNHAFLGEIRVTSLVDERGLSFGYAISISDQTELHQLRETLIQSERTRALGLICAAGARRLFKNGALGTPTNALGNLVKLLADEQPRSSLGALLTSLLEVVDGVMSPEVSIKVDVNEKLELAVRPSDLFQLFGFMVLKAVEFAGVGGQVEIRSERDAAVKNLWVFVVTAHARRLGPALPSDRFSHLLRGNFENAIERALGNSSKLPYGLNAAQSIADAYKVDVEFAKPTENTMKLRVKLPEFTETKSTNEQN
ncbi:MAG: PAS domain-containing protein, partial [Bdellovibrionales bacterium]|nr:PAS domain-containing protein [Bdellovibrionales bacterium]